MRSDPALRGIQEDVGQRAARNQTLHGGPNQSGADHWNGFASREPDQRKDWRDPGCDAFETRGTEIRGVESDRGIGIGIEAIVTSNRLDLLRDRCTAFLTSTLSGHGETTRHCSVTQTGGLESSCCRVDDRRLEGERVNDVGFLLPAASHRGAGEVGIQRWQISIFDALRDGAGPP